MKVPPITQMKESLSKEALQRYARHISLPGIGIDGQRRIANAKVLCIGAGGLGSPILLYLAAAGVGTLGIIDFDRVDASNLQRQIIHSNSSVGELKVISAKHAITELNSDVAVVTYAERLTHENALEIFSEFDLVIDATDNFATRYLANDAAVLLRKPYIWGSIFQFDGQVSTFWAEHGPCYRCLHANPPAPGSVPSCSVAGVLGVLCGTIGSLQATEALKLITGFGDPLIGRVLSYDGSSSESEIITLKKNPNCPICSTTPTQTALLESYEDFCGEYGGIGVGEMKAKLATKPTPVLIDVREVIEWDAGHIEGAVLVPLSGLLAGEADNLLAAAPEIIFYCRSGKRSETALRYARTAGYRSSTHLAGGYIAYSQGA